jgi:hypothetical protein
VSKNIDCYHNLKNRRNIIFEGIMEIWERYGRDEKNLHHTESPLYKGDTSGDGRDEGFFCKTCKSAKRQPDL